MDERNYLQNGGKYDCQQASRGYRQECRPNGKQRTHKSKGANSPSHRDKEPESGQENEKQCQYLKYPLPPSRVPLKSKPSGSHQCQVMVNTPRYYKQKPHRHPSALSIPLLSRPESEIQLKARSRTKKDDESSVKDKRRRAKHRTATKHRIDDEPSQKQKSRPVQQTDVTSLEASSDEDDLRSVSLRAYSSGCLSVDISSQVGDLVKAFNTVSKRHKVKKIVYEEIEPIYQKCELQQLRPQKKCSQRKPDKHMKKPEPNYDLDTEITVPENAEDLESKCTCNNDKEISMKAPMDQCIGEKKDVDRLEKLFLEVFAQGKVEGLPKQKKLDCLQDAYNQYSAALEDFSNNQEIDSDGCILSPDSIQQNFISSNQYGTESCDEGSGHQSDAEKSFRARRRYRNSQNREGCFNESIDGDGFTCNEQEPIETNQQVMQCTCNHRNDKSNSKHSIEEYKNEKVNHRDFPYSQSDFSQMLTNQRQNTILENTAESSFENTDIIQQDTSNVDRCDGTYNCSRSNCMSQNQIDSEFHNKERLDGIDNKNSPITPDSGITRTLNSRLSSQLQEQNENIKASTPHSNIPCPAPPKLSISDDHFRPGSRHHYCGHMQCYQRSKSKGVEIANMEKRQLTRNNSKDGQSTEAKNLMYNQEGPIVQSDFPSEVPNSNRSRTQINSSMLQPRKPNYDTGVRRPEINRNTDNNICNNRTDSIKNVNINGQNNPSNHASDTDNIGFNPFLNFLLQNDSNYNIPNIVPESQSVYFCDITPNLQQQYNIKQNEECDGQSTFTIKPDDTSKFQNPTNTNFLLNARSSSRVAKWHDMNRDRAQADQMTVTGNEDKQNNQTTDDHCRNTQRILDEVREGLAINSNENSRNKPSFEQINKTCSDQSSYKNYIESIIDHSTEIMANNTQCSAPIKSQSTSKCQTDLKLEGETATDLNMDDSASQIDSKLNQEISQRLNDRLVHSEKGISPASLVTLEEPEYLQHLKKLRWDHLRHISREVHRLENLERFLDSCGCGHMMIHKGMT